MKTADRDIEKMNTDAFIKWVDNKYDNNTLHDFNPAKSGFHAGYDKGYTQAQEDMMKDVANAPLIAKDFQEWLKGAFEKHRQDWSRHGSSLKHFENMLNHAFTAGRLSGLKEREYTAKLLEESSKAKTELEIRFVHQKILLNEYGEKLYKFKKGLNAIMDYADLHYNRQDLRDVQYVSAIEDKCKELFDMLTSKQLEQGE